MATNHHGSLCPTLVLNCASASDLGMRRSNNQDALAVHVTDDVATWATRGHLLMVADGMGAHAAGELASKIAADNIPHTYFKRRDLAPPAALRQAIRDANNAIHSKGQSSIGFQGMGTTCSCLVLLPHGALVAHIGDSRVYRLRGHVLEQLTFDHSLVWEMAAAGHIAETDVPAYIPKNVITRSLGPHASVHVDMEGPYSAAAGDVFLLCTDGLSGQVCDEELAAILQCLEPEEAVETLVDLANLRGGPDNISVIVARVEGNLPASVELSSASSNDRVPAERRWTAAPLWLAVGACLATLLYFLSKRLWAGAAVSAVGMIAALVAAAMLRARPMMSACPAIGPIGGPYGNGPYRRVESTPNERAVTALTEIAEKLRALPEKEPGEWRIDWQAFDAELSAAAAAVSNGDHTAAVREYCRAIHTIMQRLREHRPTIDPESDAL